jgi:cold shock CspA family protein
MQTGVVKRFCPASGGYGFIVPDDESPDVFFHVKNCFLRGTYLQVGDQVEYEINQFSGRDGRRRAACEVRKI